MSRPLILVSNDDGIDAPGLHALVAALDDVGEVWTVAPDGERSASSHALTLWDSLAVKQVCERTFAVDGWPADCVYLGLFVLLPRRPDLVVTGINAGANLGTDVYYSGTIGAAREAYMRHIPAIAMSLVTGGDYGLASTVAADLAREVLASDGPPLLLNVNVPGATATGVRTCQLGRRHYPERGVKRGTRGEWTLYDIGGGLLRDELLPGSDGEAIDRGFVSVTPLSTDATATDQLPVAARLVKGLGPL